MSQSTFNVDAFLQTEHKESLDTKVIPVPIGEHMAQITKISAKKITSKTNEEFTVVDLLWTFLGDDVIKETKQERPMGRQSIFVDLTPQGGLDMSKGKNIGLGRVRDAVGQNKSGKAWKITDLTGQTAMVVVKHRLDEAGDPIADITRVLPLT